MRLSRRYFQRGAGDYTLAVPSAYVLMAAAVIAVLSNPG